MSTVRDIVQRALRKIGVVAHDEAMTADYAANGVFELNSMLKAWNNYRHSLWIVTTASKVLTTAASYQLTIRPIRIQSVRFKRSGIETPMQEISRQEYDALPDKTVTGVPTSYYFNSQATTGTVFIWPVLAAAAGETLEITYERELTTADELNDAIDAPANWEEAVLYNLAARLAPDYGKDASVVAGIAVGALQLALSSDREGSIYFCGDDYDGGYGWGSGF